MKIFLNRLKENHVCDQVVGFFILVTLCMLAFLGGIDWGRDHPRPILSTEITNSSCKLTPGLCKLEDLLEKIRGEQ
jgi:hypothetical protein